MAQASGSNTPGSGFGPSTHFEIGTIWQFGVLSENVYENDELCEHQKVHIRARFDLQTGCGVSCGCNKVPHNCCIDDACPNRQRDVACGLSCHHSCQNNPWDRNTFAIDHDKIHVAVTDSNGAGLYAKKRIEQREMVGEYTGVVRPKDSRVEYILGTQYYYTLPVMGHIVDATYNGSAMRMIRNHHNPSCRAGLYVHNGLYKIVIEAVRPIEIWEEITITYSRIHEHRGHMQACSCGAPKCDKLIGTLMDHSAAQIRDPVLFSSLTDSGSAKVQNMLSGPIYPREFNITYVEDHCHEDFTEVGCIIQEKGWLAVTLARVIECYQNKSGKYLYVCRQTSPAVVDHHLPRWLVFRHIEYATAMLMEGIWSEGDKTAALDYLVKKPCKATADEVDKELVEDYVQKLTSGTLPRLIPKDRYFPGGAAIGLTDVVLKKDSSNTHQYPSSTLMNRFQYINFQTKSVVFGGPVKPLECRASTKLDGLSIITPDQGYNARQTRNIFPILHTNKPQALLKRQMIQAAENVSFLMLTRLPKGVNLDFNECFDIASGELKHYYFNVQPLRMRKFLRFSHFQLACEVEAPGSVLKNWCGLCKTEKTLTSPLKFNDHYREFHYICTTHYKCFDFRKRPDHDAIYPSAFLKVVLENHPETIPLFRSDRRPYLMDSYADVVAMKSSNNRDLHILKPGMPNMSISDPTAIDEDAEAAKLSKNKKCATPTQNTVPNTSEKKEVVRPAIDMNPLSNSPIDPSKKMTPLTFAIQKSHSLFLPGDKLDIVENTRYPVVKNYSEAEMDIVNDEAVSTARAFSRGDDLRKPIKKRTKQPSQSAASLPGRRRTPISVEEANLFNKD